MKASTSADVLNLTGKTISVDVQNKDGMIHTTHGATIVSGDIIIGSELSDTLNGSSIADRLEGGGGNDTLTGGDGNDIIRGGAGVDKIDGGAGDDGLSGGAGNDTFIYNYGIDGYDEVFDTAADDGIDTYNLLNAPANTNANTDTHLTFVLDGPDDGSPNLFIQIGDDASQGILIDDFFTKDNQTNQVTGVQQAR